MKEMAEFLASGKSHLKIMEMIKQLFSSFLPVYQVANPLEKKLQRCWDSV